MVEQCEAESGAAAVPNERGPLIGGIFLSAGYPTPTHIAPFKAAVIPDRLLA